MTRRARAIRGGATASAALAALAVLVGCASGPLAPTPTPTPTHSFPAGDGVLRIGTLLPTSGDQSGRGPGMLAGVRAAVREINAEGGVLGARVELVSRSSGSELETLEASLAELLDRDVDAIVGPSDAALALHAAREGALVGVPIVSVGTSSPQLAAALDDGWLFRTTPSMRAQGSALGDFIVESGAATVALATVNGPHGMPLLDGLGPAVRAGGGEIVAVVRLDAPAPGDAAEAGDPVDPRVAAAMTLADLDPDAVVIATADGGEDAQLLLSELVARGTPAESLWLASASAVDYTDTDAEKPVEGAWAWVAGNRSDAAFRAQVQQEDPGARSLQFAADAYDATMLVALAALAAGGEAGLQIRDAIADVAADGVPCGSFGECARVIADGQSPDYDGRSGPLTLTADGDLAAARYDNYRYDGEGKLVWSSTTIG